MFRAARFFFVVPSYRLPLIDNHYIDGLFLLRTPFTRSKGDAPQNYVNNRMRQAAFSWQRNAIAYAIIWRGANDIIFFSVFVFIRKCHDTLYLIKD